MTNLSRTPYLLVLALTTLVAAGCDDAAPGDAEDFGDGAVSERCLNGCGGIVFNTFAWGTVDGGELDRRGALWAGAKLISVELACTKNEKDMWRYPLECKKAPMFKLDDVWATAGELLGTRSGLKFGAADFLGSRWTVELYNSEGKFTTKHVQEIKAYAFNSQQQPHALHYYTFMFFGDGTNGGEKGVWTPACDEDTDPLTGQIVGSKAIVYDDITVDTATGTIGKRSDTLYLGCISAAVGKAGNWGYPSWEIGHEDFTTAVRSVRADYCGDGRSWTKKGNALQITDVWGYSSFGNAAAKTEALWRGQGGGALCLGTPRWIGTYDYSDVICGGAKLKPCDSATLATYGEAVLWSKLP